MTELWIVGLLLLNASLAIPAAKVINAECTTVLKSAFTDLIEADNDRKTQEWLKEKKRYEQDGTPAEGS